MSAMRDAMIMVTGAAGFIGRGLVERLCATGTPLTLVDTKGLGPWAADAAITSVEGSVADRAVLARALAGRPRTVFHLASVPGGQAERNHTLGRSVNLDGTLTLLEMLAETNDAPVLVFASSIAVFGGPLPNPVPERQPPRPLLSYGAQKLIGEVLVADFARRGAARRGRRALAPAVRHRDPAGTATEADGGRDLDLSQRPDP